MDFLPIKYLRNEDFPQMGRELIYLARLHSYGIPVADGIVVSPPVEAFNRVLKKRISDSSSDSTLSQAALLNELGLIEAPFSLEQELEARLGRGQQAWDDLLAKWIKITKSRSAFEDFHVKKVDLPALPVFFVGKLGSKGNSRLNKNLQLVETTIEEGTLHPTQFEALERAVTLADKKLLFNYNYGWVLDGEAVKFVRLSHDSLNPNQAEKKYPLRTYFEKKSQALHSIKIFYKQVSGLVFSKEADGLIVCSNEQDNLDRRIFRLTESAVSLPNRPVIYLFSDTSNGQGVLFDVEAVLFARNKKQLLNVEVAIPAQKNVSELLQTKRDLASRGLSRKGSLKFWLEMATPENLMNIESYIEAGIDGVILNYGKVAALFNGSGTDEFYQFGSESSLNKFLLSAIKILQRADIPVILDGILKVDEYELAHLTEKGLWGLVVTD